MIRVLKQEMGLGKRLVRKEERLKGWIGVCLIGLLLCLGREGKYRGRRDKMKEEIKVSLCNHTLLGK